MKRFALFLIVSVALLANANAQNNIVSSLQQSNPGQGKVSIHQDSRITALLGSTYVPVNGEQRVIKSAGYRIQLYAGNNTRQAKKEAQEVSEAIKQSFPDLTIYTSFNPPRWLCRVGDFRSIEEADAMMRQIKATGDFKEVSIVKDYINIPL